MKRLVLAIVTMLALASIADAHGRSFGYGRSFSYGYGYAAAAIVAAPVYYPVPVAIAAPVLTYAQPVYAQSAVPCVPQAEQLPVQAAPVAACAQTAALFAPSYQQPVYAAQQPVYSAAAVGYGAAAVGVGYGVNRAVFHRDVVRVNPLRNDVIGGGSAVVVQQRGLFGRSNTVVAGGGSSVVVQQRGLFGRSSTVAVGGVGSGATIVNQRGIFRR